MPPETRLDPLRMYGPTPGRDAAIIGGVFAVAIIMVALCGIWTALLVSLASRNPTVPQEWTSTLNGDYPGWRRVGFKADSYTGSGAPETTYAFTLIPPGRSFPVTVTYVSTGGAPAVSQDEVLRSGAPFADRSSSLLDFIDTNYVRKGRDVTATTTNGGSDVTVAWRKLHGFLWFTWTTGSFDQLKYDEGTRKWYVYFSGGGGGL